MAKGSDLGVVGFGGDLVVVCAGPEDSVFAASGFDAGVESGGTGRSLIVFSRAATGSLASLAF